MTVLTFIVWLATKFVCFNQIIHDRIFQPVTLPRYWAEQFKLYFLHAEHQAKEQLVALFKSMVWLSQGLNLHPGRIKQMLYQVSHYASPKTRLYLSLTTAPDKGNTSIN